MLASWKGDERVRREKKWRSRLLPRNAAGVCECTKGKAEGIAQDMDEITEIVGIEGERSQFSHTGGDSGSGKLGANMWRTAPEQCDGEASQQSFDGFPDTVSG